MAGTIVANTINTDTGLFSTNNAYSGIAKAWVQFSANTGSIVINGSFNVSSLTRNSAGDYTLNFATAMTNANYATVGNGAYTTSGNFVICYPNCSSSSPYYQAPTTSAVRTTWNYNPGNNSTLQDPYYGNIVVFGS
jgi:pantothenate kinase